MSAAATVEETLALLERAKAGDKAAEAALVEENTGLVWSIVRRFVGRGHEPDDLFQVGALGLLKAIQKFDTGFGVRFSTYAVPMIMGEIKRFLRDDGMIKVSRSYKVLAGKARTVKEELAGKLGRDPSIAELAAAMQIEPAELATALDATQPHDSLFAPFGEDEKVLLIDKVSGGASSEGDTVDRIAVRQLLAGLPEREQKILYLRYFQDQTQTQVAKKLGISQVQVSRIEKKMLLYLRERLMES